MTTVVLVMVVIVVVVVKQCRLAICSHLDSLMSVAVLLS